jgi:hypothetical protein
MTFIVSGAWPEMPKMDEAGLIDRGGVTFSLSLSLTLSCCHYFFFFFVYFFMFLFFLPRYGSNGLSGERKPKEGR